MDPRECPGCGTQADRVPPSTTSYTFNQAATSSGPVPQNTGVSAFDYNADRVIGAEAQKNWSVIEEREAHKREVLRETGTSSQDLSLLPDGSYRVMGEQEKRSTRNTRAFHNIASGLAQSKDRYRILREASQRGSRGK